MNAILRLSLLPGWGSPPSLAGKLRFITVQTCLPWGACLDSTRQRKGPLFCATPWLCQGLHLMTCSLCAVHWTENPLRVGGVPLFISDCLMVTRCLGQVPCSTQAAVHIKPSHPSLLSGLEWTLLCNGTGAGKGRGTSCLCSGSSEPLDVSC